MKVNISIVEINIEVNILNIEVILGIAKNPIAITSTSIKIIT